MIGSSGEGSGIKKSNRIRKEIYKVVMDAKASSEISLRFLLFIFFLQ